MQFDVFEKNGDYIINLQSIDDLNTCVCCFAVKAEKTKDVHIEIEINNEKYLVVVSKMMTLNKQQLKNKVGNLSNYEFDFKNAIDALFFYY